MSEEDIKNSYLSLLKIDFNIDVEVEGIHFTGKKLNLDAVVRPRNNKLWKNENTALGIEFKDTARFRSNFDTKDFTKWLAQCIDYSNTRWGKYGYLYIFACPSITDNVPEHVLGNEQFVVNLMSQLGVGELKKLNKYGLTFILNGRHRVWSRNKGVEAGKSWNLLRKFGSR